MQNSSFNAIVVRDSRIQDISSKLDVAVYKGAASSTYQAFPATSQSTSSVNFNVVVPSENIVIDREITWTATPTIRIAIAAGVVADATLCMDYGVNSALNQFPLNALLTNATVSINTQSISVNTQDILHTLIRTVDDDKLSKYNCPHMSDKRFKNYSDMILSESNPLGSFIDAKGSAIPRGAHPVIMTVRRYVAGALTNTAVNTANTLAQMTTALTCSAIATNSWEIDLTFTATEPLLFMSPFIYGANSNNNAGLYGVNNMNFTFSIDSSAKRSFCSANGYAMTVSLLSLASNQLNLNFLTCQPSDLLASKNVVPLCEYSRYLTVDNTAVVANTPKTLTSNALQLSQIPNRIFIVVRKSMNAQSYADSNTFFSISGISVNFNNLGGILSGATASDLYKMSVRNGSRQDMYEFLGSACVGRSMTKTTAGSILIIDPSKDLHLPDYLSNGSTGQFSFQFSITVKNDAAVAPEIMIITENDGLFISQAGQSFKQTSLLTKELVMNATMAQYGESDRYVQSFGDGNGLNLCSAQSLKNVPLMNQKKASVAEPVESSGGAFSGGAFSGGRAMSGGYF